MELFKHQKEGIKFLKLKPKAIIADEMGLGKTRQAIMAAREGRESTLIICPASLKINWKREIGMVYPSSKDPFDLVNIIESDWKGPSPSIDRWYVINYDILDKHLDKINLMIERGWITNLILDEAHYIKGKSLRTACVVGGNFKPKGKERIKFEGITKRMKKVYCLTGTPMLNRPIELFNLLKAIEHPLSKQRTEYAKRYCGAYLQMIYTRNGMIRITNESGATNLPELREHLKGWMIRRKKADVLDLPKKIVSTMDCEMTPEWRKAYDNAWDLYLKFLAENPMPEKNIDNIIMARQLVEIQKLKQVCSQSKVKRIVADIENSIEQDQKVIVFSQYTNTIKELEKELTTKKIGWVQLTGENDMEERQKAVDDFQNKENKKVFVANIKAGGVGLNLTGGSIVMFADMEWSPEIHRQAEDRAHRIGQKEVVSVYYYVCNETIEDDIIEILNSKKAVMDQVLEGTGSSAKVGSMQEAFLKRMVRKVANS